MNGNEHFTLDGEKINITTNDFWKWAYSDLSSDTNRSILAEYIVSLSLGRTSVFKRTEFTHRPYDVITKDGFRIEIKSTAYINSKCNERPDCVLFSIARNKELYNSSDAFVFCVYKGMSDKETPLNIDLWDFYVISTEKLYRNKPIQKTITLPSLIDLAPIKCNYYKIDETIKTAVNA